MESTFRIFNLPNEGHSAPLDSKSYVPIKKGQLVALEGGCYSDFFNIGVFKATQAFKPDDLLREWFKLHPEQSKIYQFKADAFVAWLVNQKNLLTEVPHTIWHLADSGDINKWCGTRTNEEDIVENKERWGKD